MKIGSAIKSLICQENVTMKQFSEKMGYSLPTYVANPLARENKMAVEKALELINGLGYDLAIVKGKKIVEIIEK